LVEFKCGRRFGMGDAGSDGARIWDKNRMFEAERCKVSAGEHVEN